MIGKWFFKSALVSGIAVSVLFAINADANQGLFNYRVEPEDWLDDSIADKYLPPVQEWSNKGDRVLWFLIRDIFEVYRPRDVVMMVQMNAPIDQELVAAIDADYRDFFQKKEAQIIQRREESEGCKKAIPHRYLGIISDLSEASGKEIVVLITRVNKQRLDSGADVYCVNTGAIDVRTNMSTSGRGAECADIRMTEKVVKRVVAYPEVMFGNSSGCGAVIL
jgi:hypothetical protein